MEKKQPLVSIVVPVYKVEAYIRECIDSILSQIYTNLEIILVNDGSPDCCPQICEEYAAKDTRVCVIHQENLGLSVARNVALDSIHGKYVVFVDSDDAIEKNCISTVIDLMENKALDAVVFEAYLLDEESNIIGDRFHVFDKYTEVSPKKALELVITDHIGSQPWKGVYRSECWKGVRFPTGRIYEDIATTYKAYANMKNPVAFIQEKLYRYRLNSQGTSLKPGINEKRIYHIFLAFKEQYEYAISNCCKDVADRCLSNAASFAGEVISVYDSSTQERSLAVKFLRSNISLIIANRYFKRQNYIKVLLLTVAPATAKIALYIKKDIKN